MKKLPVPAFTNREIQPLRGALNNKGEDYAEVGCVGR